MLLSLRNTVARATSRVENIRFRQVPTPECSHSGVFGFRGPPYRKTRQCGLFGQDCPVEIPLSTSRQPDSSWTGPATPSCGWPAPWLTGFWKGARNGHGGCASLGAEGGSACARRCPLAFAEGRWCPQGVGVAICLQRQMQQDSSPGSDRIAQRGTNRVRLHSRWRRRISDCGEPAHEATAMAAWPAPNSLRASLGDAGARDLHQGAGGWRRRCGLCQAAAPSCCRHTRNCSTVAVAPPQTMTNGAFNPSRAGGWAL